MKRRGKSYPLAPMSRTIAWISLLLGVLPVVLAVWLSATAGRHGGPVWLGPAIGGFVAAVLVGIALAGRPSRFELTTEGLAIVWPVRRRRVSPQEIVSARAITTADLGRAWRAFGAGGFLGGFGLFRSSQIGWFDLYTSGADHLVLIERRNKRPLVISPDRPRELVDDLQSLIDA